MVSAHQILFAIPALPSLTYSYLKFKPDRHKRKFFLEKRDHSSDSLFMFGIGTTEFFVIFVIVLIVLGPKQLPKLARSLGRALNEFKDASRELKANLMEETKELKTEIDGVKGEIGKQLKSLKAKGQAVPKSEKEKPKSIV
jgi:sec-independent protein translocase protein TatB